MASALAQDPGFVAAVASAFPSASPAKGAAGGPCADLKKAARENGKRPLAPAKKKSDEARQAYQAARAAYLQGSPATQSDLEAYQSTARASQSAERSYQAIVKAPDATSSGASVLKAKAAAVPGKDDLVEAARAASIEAYETCKDADPLARRRAREKDALTVTTGDETWQ